MKFLKKIFPCLYKHVVIKKESITITYSIFEYGVFNEINKYRKSIGVKPLMNYSEGIKLAREHSKYMANEGKISHDNFYLERSDILRKKGAFRVSENVGFGYETPKDFLNGWLNSESHRKVIIDPNLTHTSIGFKLNDKGVQFGTQIFLNF